MEQPLVVEQCLFDLGVIRQSGLVGYRQANGGLALGAAEILDSFFNHDSSAFPAPRILSRGVSRRRRAMGKLRWGDGGGYYSSTLRTSLFAIFSRYRFDSFNPDQLRKRNLALFKRKESILGIDISSSSIKLVELSRSGPRFGVELSPSNRWARDDGGPQPRRS